MKSDVTMTVEIDGLGEAERIIKAERKHRMLRVVVFALVAGLSAGLVSAALSGCGAAQRKQQIDTMSKGVAVAADVAARAAGEIEKWATAQETEIARLAPSREVGEAALRAFERRMEPVDRAVSMATLAIEAAALAVAGLGAADESQWLVAAAAVKGAYDAVRALERTYKAVRR